VQHGRFQDTGTVAFNKLVRFLGSLKGVSRVEKYHAGIYSIINVEQFILRHLDQLKKSITRTASKLGHAQKVPMVSERDADLNEMKSSVSFLPTINEHVSGLCLVCTGQRTIAVFLSGIKLVESNG
jgi:hypothetical protein